jgi:flagellar biosynthetic protein FliQ
MREIRWPALDATRHLADATGIAFDTARRPASAHRTPRIHESHWIEHLMDQDTAIHLSQQAMELSMKIGGPLLLVGLAIGLIVSVFQAVTQIQEQSLSFIPKIVGVAVVIVVAGPWMLGQLLGYTEELYRSIPALVGGG